MDDTKTAQLVKELSTLRKQVKHYRNDIKQAKKEIYVSKKLIETLNLAQAQFIRVDNLHNLFSELLDNLLLLTQSEYGFIGELFTTAPGNPYLKTHAITNISWNKDTENLYNQHAATGMEFYNLDNLFGEVITTGQPVISNNPCTTSRRVKLPEGHPPLHTFMGLPLYYGEKLVGMVAVANRPDGYDEKLISYLEPLLSTCANIIESYRIDQQRKQAVEVLKESEDKFRNLAEQSPNMIFINKMEKIVYANKKCEEIMGYKKEEFYAPDFDFRCLIAPESLNITNNNFRAHQRGEDIGPYEYKLITKKGENVNAIHTTKIIRYENEPAILAIVTDITKRKCAEEALLRREAYLEVLAYMGQRLLSCSIEEGGIEWIECVSPLIARLGTVAGVDRAYIFENHRDETGDLLCSQRCEWLMKEIKSQIDNPHLQNISYGKNGISRWEQIMSRQEVVNGPIGKFPQKERQLMEKQNIRSLLAVPIFTNDGWWGFLGLCDCKNEREWHNGEIVLLQSAAITLGQYFNKTKAETERNSLQAQLCYSQKMESIGTLAGGIAHNFNNILCGILGYVSLIKSQMDPSNEFYDNIYKVENLAKRASILTRKLLGFARGRKSLLKPLECTRIISLLLPLLKGSLKKDITLETTFQCTGFEIMGDESQIRQAVLNLCFNAQDAMPDGGKLYILGEIKEFNDSHFIRGINIPPGIYFVLQVIDTGEGIPKQAMEHIFEPFFTTKEVGKGSGLGLAIVYGTIKEHKGFIDIQSTQGSGTSCTLYFPAIKI